MGIDNNSFSNFGFDIGKDAKLLGRLKLPYKSFNFLSLLSKQYGTNKYDSAKDLIELCQWMYVHISDIRNIINRLAEYVITDLQIDDTYTQVPKDNQQTLLDILNKVNLKSKLVQIAKLYFATGNVMTSVECKFKKHLQCPRCQTLYNINKINFTFDTKNINYIAKCINSKCKYLGPMNILDVPSRSPENIQIKIWDWHDIEFNYNPISDEYRYYYKIPHDIVKEFFDRNADKFLLETTPHYMIKDIFEKKRVSNKGTSDKFRTVGFQQGKIKHIKNDSIMLSVMGGWGEPLTIGVLQDAFFMQLLRQAQAVLLADYIIPIRIVSPDPSAVSMMDINLFAKNFDELYAQFQKDPMQIMKAPFPIQYQTMTGEGKTLFLSNEMDYTRNAIRRGLGAPAELLDGGLQNFSSGQISLRMLENFFANFLNNVMNDLVNNFFIPNICIALKMPSFKVTFAKFKTLDDVQQKQAKLNLYDRNLISDTDIYSDYDTPRPSEKELMESVERKGKRDGKYQLILGDYQAEAQSNMSRKTVQDQFEVAAMQEKEQKVMNAKMDQDPNAAIGPNANKNVLSSDKTQAGGKNTLSPTGEQLQDPEQLGDYALSQLQTQDELNSFIGVLQQQLPDNPDYVQSVADYINKNFQGSKLQPQSKSKAPTKGGVDPKKNNVTNSDTRPRDKDGGVNVRPPSPIKPPRAK